MAKVFISYSHQDEGWKDRVVAQLRVLAGEGLVTWVDRKIGAGSDWEPEINNAIATCDVALLLISTHFLTSEFILTQEVPPLLKRRERDGIRVIPVIVSPCPWTRTDWLKSMQPRPKDGKPLSGMSAHDAEAALSALAGEVADLMAAPKSKTKAEEADAEPLNSAAQSGTSLQKQLAELLNQCWAEQDFAAFAKAFKPKLEQEAYFQALCNCTETQQELIRLRGALGKATLSNSLAPDVSNTIALSALVLYERYCVQQGGYAGEVTAANLLLAAVQASARYGSDAVVKGSGVEDGEVVNAAALPGAFIPFKKEGEAEPEWEEIKRSLNVSAESVLEIIGNPCCRAMRAQFALRKSEPPSTHWNISDAELKGKLQTVKELLGGQFVFFVDQIDAANILHKADYKQRLEQTFGVYTVIWKKEQESHDVARQIKEIFAWLYRKGPEENKPSEPPHDGEAAVNTLDQINTGLEKITRTAEQTGKLMEAGAKIAKNAGMLSSVWKIIKNTIGF